MSATPEIEAAMKLAHRSPTYAFTTLDGRTLMIRREAIALKRNATEDAAELAKGGGVVRWWARCDGRETTGDALGDVLVRVLGVGGLNSTDADFDAFWDAIKLIVSAALALAEAAVPNEPQQAVYR